MMAFVKNENNQDRYECTPEEYKEARIAASNAMKSLYSNKENHPCYGKHVSEETRAKQSKVAKERLKDKTKNNMYGKRGINNPNYGTKRSPEFLKKESDRMLKYHKENPNIFANGNNPNAKKVIRLSDKKIYDCGKSAAIDNGIKYPTFKSRCQNGNGFMYYDLYIEKNSKDDLEKC